MLQVCCCLEAFCKASLADSRMTAASGRMPWRELWSGEGGAVQMALDAASCLQPDDSDDYCSQHTPLPQPGNCVSTCAPQEVDAVLTQHIHELERSFKQSLDSRHLSSMAAAAATAAGGGSSGTQPGGGPGGARGLTIPAPGAAGSWQVCALHSCLWVLTRGGGVL